MKKIFLFFIVLSFWGGIVSAQDTILLDGSTTGVIRTCSAILYDAGGAKNNYTAGGNYEITLAPEVDFIQTNRNGYFYRLTILSPFDVSSSDTLYIYDRTVPIGTLGLSGTTYYNNSNKATIGATFDAGTLSAASLSLYALKFKFVSAPHSTTAQGWAIKVECIPYCQEFNVGINDFFYKMTDGERISFPVKDEWEYETEADGSVHKNYFKAIDICNNDVVVLKSKGDYFQNNTTYTQSDETSTFTWILGYGKDTTVKNSNELTTTFPSPIGYNLSIKAQDLYGCESANSLDVRVRVSDNPILSIRKTPDVCTQQPFRLSAGNDMQSLIRLSNKTSQAFPSSKYNSLSFIPDGTSCGGIGLEASVNFQGFPSNDTIKSKEEIVAVCFTLEHSRANDLDIKLICPQGKGTVDLKLFNNNIQGVAVAFGTRKYGLKPDESGFYDINGCNSSENPPGGNPSTYCWSEKSEFSNRGLMTNYLASTSSSSLKPTDIEGKKDFYAPVSSFSNLIGCQLNGTWSIELKDRKGGGNGWIYEWFVELSSEFSNEWSYTVGIDSVVWDGAFPAENSTPNAAYFHPDSAGVFNYNVAIIDSFACQWNTATSVIVHQSPIINLGPDTLICDGATMILDAENPETNYLWEPYGQTTPKIEVEKGLAGSTIEYKVMATNNPADGIYCTTIDTIQIAEIPTPSASFWAEPMPMEGCEPLTIQFRNTSPLGSSFVWYFGEEGISTEKNPTYTFKAGDHDVSLVSINEYQCTDTAFYKSLVQVFSKPEPDFRWNPRYPSTKQDTIHFINKTEPQSDKNEYIWRIQDDRDNPNSFFYILDSVAPSYKITSKNSTDIAGRYGVTLYVTTRNTGKSGLYYVCQDSISHDIMVVNDFLQFPNVVTANGDGINDIFKIVNLVSGQAFPNNELFIYDRWGRKVYHKKNMDTENDYWDPAADNISAGSYFFRFVGKGYSSDVEYKGAIEVIR